MLERTVLWTPWDEVGLEHLRLVQDASSIVADGMIIHQHPFRLHYVIRCDLHYRVREVTVDLFTGRLIKLTADGEGRWWDGEGASLPALDGCLDVDISATPFTNTLPIKRLGLKPGESREIAVVYIVVPEMEVRATPQRYTCLQAGLYRYDNVTTSFTAVLPVDADGLVLDYPQLFRRVYPV